MASICIHSPISPRPEFPILPYNSKASVPWTSSPTLKILLVILLSGAAVFNLIIFRLVSILSRQRPSDVTLRRPIPSKQHTTHLLVVLGSGGHTAEMLNMLQRVPLLQTRYTYRTYIVSSGDAFSSLKAREFEDQLAKKCGDKHGMDERDYYIMTVRRARRVHQSILTAPWSASLCLWDCLKVLQGHHDDQFGRRGKITPCSYPDIILTNGPATGVCVVLSALILRFCGISRTHRVGKREAIDRDDRSWPYSGDMRTIFIESWARVQTLSLSGKILLPIVDRFLVQWPSLEGKGGKAEYVGALVT